MYLSSYSSPSLYIASSTIFFSPSPSTSDIYTLSLHDALPIFVFGKDGWLVKSKGIDAYAGVDVAGKVVVLYSPTFSPQTMIPRPAGVDRKSTRLNSSHLVISYAVFCLKKKI